MNNIKDGYTAAQIPLLANSVWNERRGRCIEASFRTQVDFLFGNSMLMRSSNRLPLELPDLFLMPLEKEGLRGDATKAASELGWRPRTSFQELVATMVQAELEAERSLLSDAGAAGA